MAEQVGGHPDSPRKRHHARLKHSSDENDDDVNDDDDDVPLLSCQQWLAGLLQCWTLSPSPHHPDQWYARLWSLLRRLAPQV